MKIIRAENIQPIKKEEIKKEVLPKEEKKHIEKSDLSDAKILNLMNETIAENKIKIEVILTKKQYELWKKKGEEKWLKQILTNRILKKGKKR